MMDYGICSFGLSRSCQWDFPGKNRHTEKICPIIHCSLTAIWKRVYQPAPAIEWSFKDLGIAVQAEAQDLMPNTGRPSVRPIPIVLYI